MQTTTVPPNPKLFKFDNVEAFMARVLVHYHTETPGLYRLAAIRRTNVEVEGKRHRVILTATGYRPKRQDARARWYVISWDVDELSIRWQRKPSRRAAVREVETWTE